MNGLRVAETAPLGDLDRVDVADEVTDRGVGRGELLAVALTAMPPGNGQVVAEFPGKAPTPGTDRGRGLVVDLAAGHDGQPLVEESDQRAHESGLALAALAEQDEVVPGQDGSLDLRPDGVLEAHDAGQGRRTVTKASQQVLLHLDLHASRRIALGEERTPRAGQSRWRARREGGHLQTVRPIRGRREWPGRKPITQRGGPHRGWPRRAVRRGCGRRSPSDGSSPSRRPGRR